MNITALIPVKGFRNAKQRLSPLLGAAEREVLAETMFRDVLREVLLARGLAGTSGPRRPIELISPQRVRWFGRRLQNSRGS